MQKKNGKEENIQANSIQLKRIARMFLYIVGFCVFAQCNLWVSVCALIVISIFLFQVGLLKKTLDFLNIPLLVAIATNTKDRVNHQAVDESNIEQNEYVDDTVPECMDVIPVPPDDIDEEDHFDAIWHINSDDTH